MGKYFGTDGIRGVAGEGLTAELAFKTGLAAASVINSARRPCVIIGKDTRVSCDMLEAALTAGLCAAGADVAPVGVLPTPAVAFLTVRGGCDMGIVISASHNSFEHNGIKIFGGDGFKLSDELENEIERLIDNPSGIKQKTHGDIGRITREHEHGLDEYIKFLASKYKGGYKGKIAVDCANGAAAQTAGKLFGAMGVNFEIMSYTPDGVNINTGCGSTHLEPLREKVKSGGFDIGIAFDGDADRCLAVDEHGCDVDGDIMLALFTRKMIADGELKGGAVGTVVSNSGMDAFFAGIERYEFLRAAVGDKNVLELMQKTGCNLGGESSGHMIFSDDATTGDGQLTAVKLLNVLADGGSAGKTLSELTDGVPHYPQVMPSYKLTGGTAQRDMIMASEVLKKAVEDENKRLTGRGRVLIRPSGTEPVIRVLAEAETDSEASAIAERFIELMKTLG